MSANQMLEINSKSPWNDSFTNSIYFFLKISPCPHFLKVKDNLSLPHRFSMHHKLKHLDYSRIKISCKTYCFNVWISLKRLKERWYTKCHFSQQMFINVSMINSKSIFWELLHNFFQIIDYKYKLNYMI